MEELVQGLEDRLLSVDCGESSLALEDNRLNVVGLVQGLDDSLLIVVELVQEWNTKLRGQETPNS